MLCSDWFWFECASQAAVVRLCVRLIAVNQTIDSMQPPGIQILLIYKRTDVSCKRDNVVDEEEKAILLTKC
jgi:hypothetical protein